VTFSPVRLSHAVLAVANLGLFGIDGAHRFS
jgi:hypothetical protein